MGQALRDCNRTDRTGYANGIEPPQDVMENKKRVKEMGVSVKNLAEMAVVKNNKKAKISALGSGTTTNSGGDGSGVVVIVGVVGGSGSDDNNGGTKGKGDAFLKVKIEKEDDNNNTAAESNNNHEINNDAAESNYVNNND